jgi:class 3 adenylate cyclase/ActR/RegA family two-component response regulator
VADDSAIVREGVRAMIAAERDLVVVGTASDYDTLVSGAEEAEPQVIVADIRMPPNFRQEGIDACHEIRKRHPGTGVVILSQYDDPDYAVNLLAEGAAGYGYLLKDRVAEGDQLARAIREVASGGSMLDPVIVTALIRPVKGGSSLTPEEEELVAMIAEGRPIKAIAAARRTTPAVTAEQVDRLWVHLAEQVSAGSESALRRLRRLHEAIVTREEQGEELSRLLPGGVAEWLAASGRRIGDSERVDVTVLMSDIRGYSGIAEHADPTRLAAQLNEHRAEMNRAVLAAGGTVMQYVGDAVMAAFGAPLPCPDHARHALEAAIAMQEAQAMLNERWARENRTPFPIGVGLSSGVVAAALLGSAERLEYTMVGDAVNLCQRLQQLAGEGQVVMSETTFDRLEERPAGIEALEETLVKGRDTPVKPYRFTATTVTTGVTR